MNRTFVAIAAIAALLLLGAGTGSAQMQPAPLRFHPLRFSLIPGPLQVDTGRLPFLRLIPPAGLLCPMPVAVPDTASLERMPVARPDTSGMAMRVARPGCVNPLGPSARRPEPPVRPRHP